MGAWRGNDLFSDNFVTSILHRDELIEVLNKSMAQGELKNVDKRFATAINKLFLKETSRLSVDMDFNAVGKKEKIMKERREIKDKLMAFWKSRGRTWSTSICRALIFQENFLPAMLFTNLSKENNAMFQETNRSTCFD